jgi:uncharacterized protein (DUF1684 family)
MDPYVEEVERWRAGRLARLTGPDGWLSLVGLAWLHEGENSIGSDPGNDVVLPHGKAPARLGSITVEGGRTTFALASGAAATVTHRGGPVTEIELDDDLASTPTVLRLGSLSFLVIRREGRLGVRVRDRDSPARAAFAGIRAFPVDPRWRIEARFEPYRPERFVPVPTVLGTTQTYRMPGALAFEVHGLTHRLDAFLEEGETDLFIIFSDATSGIETFAGGRYLYAKPPDDRGVVVLDFNRAYNPPCVFTPFATCALPLAQNRLGGRIEAGEMRYEGHDSP